MADIQTIGLIAVFILLATLALTFILTLYLNRDGQLSLSKPQSQQESSTGKKVSKAAPSKARPTPSESASALVVVDGTTLTPGQVEEFRETFSFFDKDGSGTITCMELGTAMRALGQYISDDDLAKLVAKLDRDGNGIVDFDEFLRLMATQMKEKEKAEEHSSNEEEFLEAFTVFDRDGNGFVDATELRYMLQHHGSMRLTDEEVDEMLADADINGDGKLNFEEFIQLMMAPVDQT